MVACQINASCGREDSVVDSQATGPQGLKVRGYGTFSTKLHTEWHHDSIVAEIGFLGRVRPKTSKRVDKDSKVTFHING